MYAEQNFVAFLARIQSGNVKVGIDNIYNLERYRIVATGILNKAAYIAFVKIIKCRLQR